MICHRYRGHRSYEYVAILYYSDLVHDHIFIIHHNIIAIITINRSSRPKMFFRALIVIIIMPISIMTISIMTKDHLCFPWPCCKLFFQPPSYSSPVLHTCIMIILYMICTIMIIYNDGDYEEYHTLPCTLHLLYDHELNDFDHEEYLR